MALSDLQVRNAKPKDKAYKLVESLGLFVLVKPDGSKLWQHKYRYLGKERLLSHGIYPNVSLAEARKRRDAARQILSDGGDPSVQKRLDQIEAEVQARMTFLFGADVRHERLTGEDQPIHTPDAH